MHQKHVLVSHSVLIVATYSSGCCRVSTGVLLAAWGLFIKLNKSAEELEAEAMEEAKKEDRKIH